MSAAIQISDATKDYPVFRTPGDGLRYLWNCTIRGKPHIPEGERVVRALDDVSLTVQPGEAVGIVGRNGAGKTTLLKLLTGDFPPTSGEFQVNGRIYTLMRDSVQFSPDLSAYENARNHLSYLGLKEEETLARLAEIEEFTELGEYFHQPVKNYSLGMRVRAEFAVATSHTADIIMIDEVLGAGDIYWAEKIAQRMDRLCGEGTTLLLVSHSLEQIMRFCRRAVWVERGQIVMDGPAMEVSKRYESFLERLSWRTQDLDDDTVDLDTVLPDLGDTTLPASGQTVVRWPGRGDARITGVWINGTALTDLELPAAASVVFRLHTTVYRTGQYAFRYLVTFWDRNGKRVAVTENDRDEVWLVEGATHEVEAELTPGELAGGTYFVTISLFDLYGNAASAQEQRVRLDVLYKSFRLEVGRASTAPEPMYRVHMQASICD